MNAIAIIGSTLAGAFVGFAAGFWLGVREGGDYNFAPALYAPAGAAVGAVIGAAIGAAAFA
jgi:hypothetical protein